MSKLRWAVLTLATIWTMGSSCSPQAALQLNDASNGTTNDAVVGQRVVLDLAENPSTGYSWNVSNSNPSSLRQDDSTFIPPVTSPLVTGAAGTREWTFTAIAPGSTTLHLEYRRPFDSPDIPAAQTFDVTVKVRGAG